MDFNSWTLTSFGHQSIKKGDVISPEPTTPKLPKIVLRNSMGFELKTATSFQNAIYRAKTKIFEPNRRLTEMEWRYENMPDLCLFVFNKYQYFLDYHTHRFHQDRITHVH